MRLRLVLAITAVLAGGGGAAVSPLSTTTKSVPSPSGTVTVAPSTDIRADPVRTPGLTDPRVTQDNIQTTICVSGYTATVRPTSGYTNRVKKEQLAADPRYVD